ncbi:hypothetical protein [Streptococcus suis]|uniref:hypothetical protein n=1 Tax=Streptococcus suis TaxID=1307 RepID=UPI00201639E6
MTEETFAQGILVGLWGVGMIFSLIWYVLLAVSNFILFKKLAMLVGNPSFLSTTFMSNNVSHSAKTRAGLSYSYSSHLLDHFMVFI